MDVLPRTWLLRVELEDTPGALARIATRLASHDCNVLGLTVLPTPGAVIDELVVQTPAGVDPETLLADLRTEGARPLGLTAAHPDDLVDAPTAALRAATSALTDPAALPEALRALLSADSAGFAPDEAGHPTPHHITLTTRAHTLAAHRTWAPFTDTELARATAFQQLLTAATAPRPATTEQPTTPAANRFPDPPRPSSRKEDPPAHNHKS